MEHFQRWRSLIETQSDLWCMLCLRSQLSRGILSYCKGYCGCQSEIGHCNIHTESKPSVSCISCSQEHSKVSLVLLFCASAPQHILYNYMCQKCVVIQFEPVMIHGAKQPKLNSHLFDKNNTTSFIELL